MNKIYLNGQVVTLKNEEEIFSAVVTEEDKIIYVGNDEEALKYKTEGSEVFDLNGKCMTPGFIDPHSHFGMQSLISTYQSIAPEPLGVVNSIDTMIEVMKNDLLERNKQSKQASYVAVGYDHEQLKEGRHPIKDDLDKVSTEIPVIAIHASLHVGSFNSKAIEVFGLKIDEPNPQGGSYGRYPGTNEINGYAEEIAFQMHLMGLVKPDSAMLEKTLHAGQELYAKAGYTTVQDGFTQNQEYQLFNFGSNNGLIDLDVFCYPPAMSVMQKDNHWIDGEFGVKFGDSFGTNNNIHFAGFKMLLDGSPQARTAWMSKPYEVRNETDDENYCGYPIFKDDTQVIAGLKYAMERNAPILTHCNGDAAADQLLRCYEIALSEINNDYTARAVMIHCQTIREDQIDLMAKFNIVPAMFPIHTYFWGDTHIKNLGIDRASKISNQKYALSKGLLPTSHEDCPVIPPNPLFSVWSSSNRKTRAGVKLGEGLTRYEALRSITYNAAYQYNIEHTHGTIEVGKKADLLVLDRNVLTCQDNDVRNTKVLQTIKNGKVIYALGKH